MPSGAFVLSLLVGRFPRFRLVPCASRRGTVLENGLRSGAGWSVLRSGFGCSKRVRLASWSLMARSSASWAEDGEAPSRLAQSREARVTYPKWLLNFLPILIQGTHHKCRKLRDFTDLSVCSPPRVLAGRTERRGEGRRGLLPEHRPRRVRQLPAAEGRRVRAWQDSRETSQSFLSSGTAPGNLVEPHTQLRTLAMKTHPNASPTIDRACRGGGCC